jgi:dTDP-glucose pyrophosphorylase
MIRQAVLLVGGLGTRLGAKTRDTPKPLLPIAGRPFLGWLIDELRRHGLSDILLLAGFRGDQIVEALGDAGDVEVLVEPSPLGTGGALRFAVERLDERFFCLNGDSLFDINLWDLAASAPDAEAILAIRPVADVSRFGAVSLDGDHIVGFAERSAVSGPGLINAGVGVFSKAILGRIAPGRATSLEAEIYPALVADRRLLGRAYDAPFIDIGVPDDLARAQTFVPGHLHRGAVVFDRDRLLVGAPDGADPKGDSWRPDAIAAVKAVNDAGLYAFVVDHSAPPGTTPDELRRFDTLRDMNTVLSAHGAHIDGVAAGEGMPSSPRTAAAASLDTLLHRFSADRSRVAIVDDEAGLHAADGETLFKTAATLAAKLRH